MQALHGEGLTAVDNGAGLLPAQEKTTMPETTTSVDSAPRPAPVDRSVRLLPIGARIRFLKRLSSGPTGDHPAFLYAEKNQGGEVTGHGCPEGHWVKTDDWPTPFGAVLGEEFEAI